MTSCVGGYWACHIAPSTPADFWAMVGAAVLLLSICYAGLQFRFVANTERNKQTFILMDKFVQGGNDSVSYAFKTLDDHEPTTAFLTSNGEAILNAWVKGQNYIDEVDDLYNRRVVNRGLLINRYYKVLSRAVQLYDRWQSAILPSCLDAENRALWERLRKRLNKYRWKKKLPPV